MAIQGQEKDVNINGPLKRKLRMGLVGGGQGSFIGRVHATAAALDNRAQLVAGALSADPQRAKDSAPEYGIPPERAYGSHQEMLEREMNLADDERIDFISIATPNDTHFEIARSSLEAGLNVVCDKPLTWNLAEAEQLAEVVDHCGAVFVLTHNYTGYPLVRQAREMILAGDLGEINAVRVTFLQGWLRTRVELEGQKQAVWRTDPKRSGAAGCFGDIGSHAYNLARYMTSLEPDTVCCHLKTFVSGRLLDDYGHAMIRFENGAFGTVTASQISHGRENDLSIEIDGTGASLFWQQTNPNYMVLRHNGQPHQVYYRDPFAPFAHPTSQAASRLPSGHPEGYYEALANIYRDAYEAMVFRATGEDFEKHDTLYPNVNDGVDGMHFIEQCVASSQERGAWLPLKHPRARR